MALNLEGARVTVESFMLDTCVITDPTEPGDAEWNEETGTYADPADATIYSGKCMLYMQGSADNQRYEGGERIQDNRIWVEIPKAFGAAVRPRHLVKITKAQDPWLLNRELLVSTVETGTYEVSRRILCELREEVEE